MSVEVVEAPAIHEALIHRIHGVSTTGGDGFVHQLMRASAARRAPDAVAVILDRLLVMVDWLAESDRRDMNAVKRVLAASTAKGEAINAHSSEERGG